MQVMVTGRHYDVSPALRSYVDARLDRMRRFADKIQSAHVTLTAEKHVSRAEIIVHLEGKDFTGKEDSEDMYSALDRVSDKMEEQLRRFRGKKTSARRSVSKRHAKGSNGAQIGTLRVLRATSVGRGPVEHDVLEAGDYPLEALTVDEAIVRLEEHNQSFLVFTNRATDLIHIVYKLEDGNYGVLNLHATP